METLVMTVTNLGEKKKVARYQPHCLKSITGRCCFVQGEIHELVTDQVSYYIIISKS